MNCPHENVVCLNHYDTFRKYHCRDCGKVLMCDCERELALHFLPYQTKFGSEYGTRLRYPVDGFAVNICKECRAEQEDAHPRAAIYGQKGKVERYYWREIYKTYLQTVQTFLDANHIEVKNILDFEKRFSKTAKLMKKQAKKFWQDLHKKSPKYCLKELTESAFLSKVKVPERHLSFEYCSIKRGKCKIGKWVNQNGDKVSPEDVALEWFEHQGFTGKKCERKLISVLVSSFCFPVIQDPKDERITIGLRNSTKGWSTQNKNTQLIRFLLPEDFGSAKYFERRAAEFNELLLSLKTSDLTMVFEKSLDCSESLRDYLWVNNEESVELARLALKVIPEDLILTFIRWTIGNFWDRQPGWPDLFVYNNNNFKFVEVKSPNDKLSLEQMQWFEWAMKESVPCEILRIDKK